MPNQTFFSNHSLRHTSTTRLFQAGVDRKVIKEFTGHVSNAVDKYQLTSNDQREQISKIIGGECRSESKENTSNENVVHKKQQDPSLEISVTRVDKEGNGMHACMCKKQDLNLTNNDSLTEMIRSLVYGRGGGKAKVKLEIEFSDQ